MGVKFIDDIAVTGSVTISDTLALTGDVPQTEELTEALIYNSDGGTVERRTLGDNAFTSGAVLTSGNQSISGLKTFTDSTAGIKAKYKSSDGSTGQTSTFTVRNGNNSASLTFVIKDGIVTSVTSSDRRLKKNIKLIGKSPSGINIYEFYYKNKYAQNYGTGKFQGVMSDEVPWRAVTIDKGGYDMVDYSMIDVEFKAIV